MKTIKSVRYDKDDRRICTCCDARLLPINQNTYICPDCGNKEEK